MLINLFLSIQLPLYVEVCIFSTRSTYAFPIFSAALYLCSNCFECFIIRISDQSVIWCILILFMNLQLSDWSAVSKCIEYLAVAKWLERWTVDAEVLGSSQHHGMEELSRSSFNHCFTPPRCNGYLALGNLIDGAGLSS